MKKSISFLTLAILTLLFSPAFSKVDPTGNLGDDLNNAQVPRSGSHAWTKHYGIFPNEKTGGSRIKCAACNMNDASIAELTAAPSGEAEESINPAGTDGGGKTGP